MNMMYVFVNTILYCLIGGIILGLIWSFGLGTRLSSSLAYSLMIGGVIGILFALINRSIVNRGNLAIGEVMFASNQKIIVITVLGAILGIITWLIRFIFF